MPTEVILPKVDMDMATGQISRWFYKNGDTIRKGEPLFEIETDKAAMEVEAPASGTLGDVTGAEGVDIPVGSAVAWIYAEGEARRAHATADAGTPTRIGPDPDVEVDSGPVTEKLVADVTNGAATGANGSVGSVPATATNGAAGGKVRATPLARRLARENNIDLGSLASGRGPFGRIHREDVEAAIAANGASASAAEVPTAPGTAMASGRALDAKPPVEARAPKPGSCAPKPSAALSPVAAGGGPLHAVWLREGAGAPVVLVHGFGSELASWRPLLGEIGDHTPVLGLDLAGHGGSLGVEAADFAALVAGVEDTLGALGVVSCHLVGHSLGGAVALAVASGIVVEARSLLLLAPAGFGPDIDTGFAEGFARATEEAPVRQWLRHLVFDPASLSDGFVRATARGRADGRHASAQTALAPRLFSNGTQHFEVRSLLAGLRMPVKIVAGTEDRVVPVRHFTGLPGRVALHLFARTGHMPQIEQRAEVGRLVRELTR